MTDFRVDVFEEKRKEVEIILSKSNLDSILQYAVSGLNPRINFKPSHSENILNAFHETRQCLASILEILHDSYSDIDTQIKIKDVLDHYNTYGYREGTHD